jgi:hypothetical protein
MEPSLGDVSAKKNKPSAEAEAAKEFLKLASDRGLALTGPDGLLKQFTKNVLETALNEEMTEHLGHEKNRAPGGRESANVTTGPAEDGADRGDRSGRDRVPRDRDGTFKDVVLTWEAATDNIGVSGYGVYRDGVRIATVAAMARTFRDVGLTAGTYKYKVDAFDSAGNRSDRTL